ncbi:ROK family transcriptional regulator [Kribbella sp. NPDC051952]|uniref:ROK family transcriptional regulator n=1 Tax=Kribbella sp. NPDC051952 TaxID=3154851 RepID=UPI003421FDDF
MSTEQVQAGQVQAGRRRLSPSRIVRAGEILELVRHGQARTTGQLADQLGVARSTVNDRVEVLLASGMLTLDAAASVGSRGRPASTLSFNPRSGVTLAAQLGISGVRLAVTDLAGEILTSKMIDIDLTTGPAAVLELVTTSFDETLRDLGTDPAQVHGIGVGMPAKIELAPHAGDADWSSEAVCAELSNWLPVPIFVDHDVNLLAFGEHCTRADDIEVLISLKVGTVIGCGVVVNGTVVQGTSGLAGEIGHTRVGASEEPCSCGNLGCLNAVASGGALARRLRANGVDAPNARAVAALARSGHVEAGHAVRMAGRDIGEVLAGVVNLLNPAVISLWGYLAEAEEQLIAGIRESIARSAQSGPAGDIRIEPATMGADAGLYGAAMMVVEHALRPTAVDSYLLTQQPSS